MKVHAKLDRNLSSGSSQESNPELRNVKSLPCYVFMHIKLYSLPANFPFLGGEKSFTVSAVSVRNHSLENITYTIIIYCITLLMTKLFLLATGVTNTCHGFLSISWKTEIFVKLRKWNLQTACTLSETSTESCAKQVLKKEIKMNDLFNVEDRAHSSQVLVINYPWIVLDNVIMTKSPFWWISSLSTFRKATKLWF